MATKYLAIAFFLQLVVMLPVHYRHTGNVGLPNPEVGNKTANKTSSLQYATGYSIALSDDLPKGEDTPPSELMLWLYVGFVYLFSALLLYFIVTETKKIIRIRQEYLGSQSTVTDRTIRLSGIPEELRSEEMIKETIENLQIGKVESVLLCKDWRELDVLVAQRMSVLRKLERAWTVHSGSPEMDGNRTLAQNSHSGATAYEDGGDERSGLLAGDATDQSHEDTKSQSRPTTRIWYGFLGLQSRKIDAIDYYEEKLRNLDEQIKSSRNKMYKPTPLAFVTMDSIAAAVRLPL